MTNPFYLCLSGMLYTGIIFFYSLTIGPWVVTPLMQYLGLGPRTIDYVFLCMPDYLAILMCPFIFLGPHIFVTWLLHRGIISRLPLQNLAHHLSQARPRHP